MRWQMLGLCFVFSFSLSFVYDAIKSKIEVVIFDLGYDITVGSAIRTDEQSVWY